MALQQTFLAVNHTEYTFAQASNHCTVVVLVCLWNKSQQASKHHQKRSFTFGLNIHPATVHLLLHINSKHNKQKQQTSSKRSLPQTKRRISNTQLASNLTDPLHATDHYLLLLLNVDIQHSEVHKYMARSLVYQCSIAFAGTGIISNTLRSSSPPHGTLGTLVHGLTR